MQFSFTDPIERDHYQCEIRAGHVHWDGNPRTFVVDILINGNVQHQRSITTKGEIHWLAEQYNFSPFAKEKISDTVKRYFNNLAFV